MYSLVSQSYVESVSQSYVEFGLSYVRISLFGGFIKQNSAMRRRSFTHASLSHIQCQDHQAYANSSLLATLPQVSQFLIHQSYVSHLNNNRIERRNSRVFYNLFTTLWTVSNMYIQMAEAQSCATQALITYVQHVCFMVRMDSSATKFDRVWIAFTLALFYWLKRLTTLQTSTLHTYVTSRLLVIWFEDSQPHRVSSLSVTMQLVSESHSRKSLSF